MGKYSESGSLLPYLGKIGCVGISGLLFFSVGFFPFLAYITFLPGSVPAQGTVVECDFKKNTCSPAVVDFTTQAGQQIRFTDSSYLYKKGDEVPVRYHPSDPSHAHIYDWGTWGEIFFLFPLFIG